MTVKLIVNYVIVHLGHIFHKQRCREDVLPARL